METAGYIIVGAICERITFGAFLLCELFVGAILYPIFGCWVWGGGWMSQLGSTMGLGHGYVDFAGSTVVHAVGGFCAMALALILGPRIGKYGRDGKPRAFPGAQSGFRGHRHVHSVVRLDGLQSRLHTGRDGFAHLRRRDQHQSGGDRRFGDGDDVLVLDVRQAGHHHGVQRNAGRPGRDHGALCVCRRPLPPSSSAFCAGIIVCAGRAVQRARHQDRRPVRRHLGTRFLRLVRRRLRRHLR